MVRYIYWKLYSQFYNLNYIDYIILLKNISSLFSSTYKI